MWKLVCFDIDGTLVRDWQGNSYWGTLHRFLEGEVGVRKNQERLRAFKEGRLSYHEWVEADLRDFQEAGFTRADFERAAQLHKPFPGARELLATLRERGVRVGIISGSITIMPETHFPNLYDDLFANRVFFDTEGRITGWEATVYDNGSKHKALLAICAQEGIDPAHTIFVGNGENDLDILREAGVGVAFRPESRVVAAAADLSIGELREVLDIISRA